MAFSLTEWGLKCYRVRPKYPDLPDSFYKAIQNYGMLRSSQAMVIAEIELLGMVKRLSPDIRERFARPLKYLQDSFGKATFPKPDDSAIFTMPVTVSSRFAPLELRGEGFPSLAAIQEIAANLKIICELVKKLAEFKETERGPWRAWFKRESKLDVKSALKNLDLYLNHRCERITFKVLKVGDRCNTVEVGENVIGQVIAPVLVGEQEESAIHKKNGYLMLPRGLRIFIMPYYFSMANMDAIRNTTAICRFMTLCHELSHKIVGTVDWGYGLENCRQLQNSFQALANAESWGFYLTESALKMKRLNGNTQEGQATAV